MVVKKNSKTLNLWLMGGPGPFGPSAAGRPLPGICRHWPGQSFLGDPRILGDWPGIHGLAFGVLGVQGLGVWGFKGLGGSGFRGLGIRVWGFRV